MKISKETVDREVREIENALLGFKKSPLQNLELAEYYVHRIRKASRRLENHLGRVRETSGAVH